MRDQVYNIAEAKMHFSKVVDRVEKGERISIARNNKIVATISRVEVDVAATLAYRSAPRTNPRGVWW